MQLLTNKKIIDHSVLSELNKIVMSHSLIILNAGSETEKSIRTGLPTDVAVERYQSQDLVILVQGNGCVEWYVEGTQINYKNAILFNRFTRDMQFVGLLALCTQLSGGQVVNPVILSFQDAAEKSAQVIRCALGGLETPKTLLGKAHALQKNKEVLYRNFTFPVVCKIDGQKGEGVELAEDESALDQFIGTHPEKVISVQEYIENTFDIRILCGFGEYFGAIKRIAKPGAFLNNVSQGGSVDTYNPTEEERNIALRSLELNQTDVAGVDLIHKDSRPVFLELNQGFGLRGYTTVHPDNTVLEQVANLIKKKYTL